MQRLTNLKREQFSSQRTIPTPQGMIETLILYIGAEWLGSQDSGIGISLVLGMTIRLAMRMGFHRDSMTHLGRTPFQGEIRCWIWAVLHEMDILYSFQLSLPTTIRQNDYDCAFPRNICDDEFGEDKIPQTYCHQGYQQQLLRYHTSLQISIDIAVRRDFSNHGT